MAGKAVLQGYRDIGCILIGDGTSFNAFRNGRAHITGTEMLFVLILRTGVTFNVLLLVNESVNIHKSFYKENRASRGLSGECLIW